MYVEDLAEYARVLLTTREMTFQLGWLRIQLILFCSLRALPVTAQRLWSNFGTDTSN